MHPLPRYRFRMSGRTLGAVLYRSRYRLRGLWAFWTRKYSRRRRLGLWLSVRMLFRRISGGILASEYFRQPDEVAIHLAILAVAKRSAGIVWRHVNGVLDLAAVAAPFVDGHCENAELVEIAWLLA